MKKSYTRTAGRREGIVNGVKLDNNLCCGLLKDPSNVIVTQEWIIIEERGGVFSGRGDSGSLVLSEEECVVGMIIGGIRQAIVVRERWDDITIVTPAEQLIDWVKQDLGIDIEFGTPM